MNRKRIFSVLAICLIRMGYAHAQMIEPDLIDYYSPSVVARVYDVAGTVRLSRERQFWLARFYKRTDSLLVVYLPGIHAAKRIDSLKKASHLEFINILGKEYMGDYGRLKSRVFANMAAEGELAYIKEEYKPDSVNTSLMKKILTNKYRFIYQTCLLNDSDSRSNSFLKNTSALYDIYAYYPLLYGRKFVGDYLARLSALKRISADTIEKIKTYFYTAISKDKYADWSSAINQAAQFYLPDTALFSGLYHDMFDQQAYELSEADRYNLVFLNRISPGAYDSVYGLIRQKNYSLVVLQYTHAAFRPQLLTTLLRKTSHYYDSLVQIQLLRDGSLTPGNQFAIGLKCRKMLNLSPEVTDSLVYYAGWLWHEKDSLLGLNPFSVIDFGPFESQHLSTLLTEDQYTILLAYRNQPQAYADAEKDWEEMEQRKLTQGFDHDETIRQLSNFNVVKYSTWNRLAHDRLSQAASVRALDENKPRALQVLDDARWNPQPAKDNAKSDVKW